MIPGRFELYPTDAGEVHFRPGVRIEAADKISVRFFVECSLRKTNGHARWDAHRTQHKHLGSSVIITEALF